MPNKQVKYTCKRCGRSFNPPENGFLNCDYCSDCKGYFRNLKEAKRQQEIDRLVKRASKDKDSLRKVIEELLDADKTKNIQ